MSYVIYFIWLLFVAIYFFQAAATGALRKGRRSASGVWPIPGWARLLCLLIGSGFAIAGFLVFIRIFQ